MPINYSDADIKAGAYVDGQTINEADVSDAGNGSLLIKLSSASTLSTSKTGDRENVTLDVKAVLKYDIANTSYKAEDVLGYRWLFFVESGIEA